MAAKTKSTKSKATAPAPQQTNPIDPPWPASGPISGSPDGRAVGEAPSDHPEDEETAPST